MARIKTLAAIMTTNRVIIGLITILFLSIISFWLCNLESIGLHGDESWMGLKAADYLRKGITQPYGLNYYTGILQSLTNSFVFKYFGIGIFQLRISGVCFNIIALILLISFLYKISGIKGPLFFLLFFSQSALYLIDLKIAWEVCSFNLFFLALFGISFYKIENNNNNYSAFWVFVFLASSIIGTYNHIIFSSLPLSFFIGLFIWKYLNKGGNEGMRGISLLLLNLLNLVFFFFFMKFLIDPLWSRISYFCFVIPFILILVELLFLKKIISLCLIIINPIFQIKFPKTILISIILICAISFFVFHGITFYQILSQKILFLRIFSYGLPIGLEWVLKATGVLILLFFVFSLVNDIYKKPDQPLAYIVIGYLGVFTLYTTGYSIRYYLIVFVLVFLYLGYKMLSHDGIILKIVLIVLITNIIIIQSSLWSLSTNQHRKVKGIHFKIGNNNTETSTHFLPFTSVLNFIKANKIGRIETSEDYFIGNTFRFYKLTYPQIDKYHNVGKIEYEMDSLGDGFKKEKL